MPYCLNQSIFSSNFFLDLYLIFGNTIIESLKQSKLHQRFSINWTQVTSSKKILMQFPRILHRMHFLSLYWDFYEGCCESRRGREKMITKNIFTVFWKLELDCVLHRQMFCSCLKLIPDNKIFFTSLPELFYVFVYFLMMLHGL